MLPEAFNIRTTYNNDPPIPTPSYDPGVKACLRMIAAEFRVVFVAGLIVEESAEQARPFSSAYFLGAHTCKLLARKRWGDQMAGRLYASCEEWPSVPYLHDDETAVAALICIDAQQYRKPEGPPEPCNPEHAALRKRIDETKALRKILCVPANLKNLLETDIESAWQDMDLVVANSSAEKCVSVIKMRNGMRRDEPGKLNKVVVEQLDQTIQDANARQATHDLNASLTVTSVDSNW